MVIIIFKIFKIRVHRIIFMKSYSRVRMYNNHRKNGRIKLLKSSDKPLLFSLRIWGMNCFS